MPALSPTMTEGTIVKWLKKEGTVNLIVVLIHLCMDLKAKSELSILSV